MKKNTNIYTKNSLVLYVNTDFKDTNRKETDQCAHVQSPLNVDSYQEVDYEQVSELRHDSFLDDEIYVCEMLDRSCYKHLEYMEVSHSIGDTLLINAEVNFRMSEWGSQINLLSFTDTMRKRIKEKHAVNSEQENLYEEDLIHIKFKILVTRHTSLPFVIQRFSKKLLAIHQEIISKSLQTEVSWVSS